MGGKTLRLVTAIAGASLLAGASAATAQNAPATLNAEQIAKIVQKSPENCRQIMRRARHNLAEHHHHYNVPPQKRELLTYQFIQACTTGDMQGLLNILADDVVMHSDGGGKVPAALKPIYGADKVARGILGLMRKIPPGFTSRLALINGQLGIMNYLNGLPYAVLAFSLANGRIQEIDFIINPDKLRGIPPFRVILLHHDLVMRPILSPSANMSPDTRLPLVKGH